MWYEAKREFIEGAARVMWADAWANHMQETCAVCNRPKCDDDGDETHYSSGNPGATCHPGVLARVPADDVSGRGVNRGSAAYAALRATGSGRAVREVGSGEPGESRHIEGNALPDGRLQTEARLDIEYWNREPALIAARR